MEISSDDSDDCQIISVKLTKPSSSSSIPVKHEMIKAEKTPLKKSRNYMINIAPDSHKKPLKELSSTEIPSYVHTAGIGAIPMEIPLENEFHQQVQSWTSALDAELAEEILQNLQPDDVVEQELKRIQGNLVVKNGGNGTPRGLSKDCKLYEHQLKGLSWMIYMEKTLGGGILADDMGLGKTIQTLALIHENYLLPSTKHGGTLIVAPLALIRQWEREILSKSSRDLKVFVYHSKKKSKMELRMYDVVITTYHVLANDAPREAKKYEGLTIPATSGGPLFQVKFRRVILDESQVIKNRHTAASKACGDISAKAMYCFSLSGTPIQNSVDDIYPQFRFIKYPKFEEYDVFNDNFGQKIQKENLAACRDVILQLQTILKSCLLRRTKAELVVKLPEKEIINIPMELSDAEKLFYKAIELKASLMFNELDRQGIVMRSITSILVLLLRLRQAATHCHLFKDVWEYALAGQFGLEFMERTRRRTVGEECPVCMDELKNVIQTPCGHVYCRDCIDGPSFVVDDEEVQRKEKSCQVCKAKFDILQLIEVDLPQIRNRKTKNHTPLIIHDENLSIKDAEVTQLLGATNYSDDVFKRILFTLHPTGDFQNYISSTKTKELVKILSQIKKEDKRAKTTVFSQWTGLLDLVQKELKICGIKYLRYDGSMNNADREAILEEFRYSKDKNVLLISLKAGGVGLNLTSACNVVMLDLWWNPAVEEQAIDRVHRIGQKRDVKVYKLTVTNTVEDRILVLQEQKRQIANGMLGEGEFKLPKLTLNDLRYLFQGTRR